MLVAAAAGVLVSGTGEKGGDGPLGRNADDSDGEPNADDAYGEAPGADGRRAGVIPTPILGS